MTYALALTVGAPPSFCHLTFESPAGGAGVVLE
jgi:hypothetical protein